MTEERSEKELVGISIGKTYTVVRSLISRNGCFVILVLMLVMFVSNTYGSLDLTDASSYRCSSGIIHIGDTKDEVFDKCGEPTRETNRGRTWIYDFGSSEFVRYITFIDNKVDRIQIGDYGGP